MRTKGFLVIIKKYLHSCILVEEGRKRLLIDPGSFCFVEKKITPADIGPVDAIILTHKHPDHYFPEALKSLCALKPTTIVCSQEIGSLLQQEGLPFSLMTAGETKEFSGFTIEAFEAPHGPLPMALPHNLAYRINNTLLHPGDSFDVNQSCKILALPIAGPWARLGDALELAERLKVKTVIPIHDAIIKDFMLERLYWMCQTRLSESKINFHPLTPGQYLEV